MAQDFKKLNVWYESRIFSNLIYKTTDNFPREEKYGFSSQLRRASSSITANIAEGCGRETSKEMLWFLKISLGSSKECENFLILSYDLKYLNKEEFTLLFKKANQISAMLTNLMKKIKNTINK